MGTSTTSTIKAKLSIVKNPTVSNLSLPVANTEVSFTFPANTKKIYIQERSGLGNVKFSYAVGQSGTTYVTLPKGCDYEDGIFEQASLTIYLQCDIITIIEILSWA